MFCFLSDQSDDGSDGEEDSREHAAESTRLGSQMSNRSNLDSQESVIQAGLLHSDGPPSKKLKVKMSFNSSKK
jgi:hypothetical protein